MIEPNKQTLIPYFENPHLREKRICFPQCDRISSGKVKLKKGKKGRKSQAGTKRAQTSTSKQEKKRTSLHVVDEAFENLRKMKRKL